MTPVLPELPTGPPRVEARASTLRIPIKLPWRHSLNVIASAISNLVTAAVGLITIPFLIKQLGTETYGVWTLIAVIAGYFTLLDFGVTIATGRLIAARRSTNDQNEIDRITSVAFILCLAIAVICIMLALIMSTVPNLFFNIPSELLAQTRISIFVSGVGVAVYFVFATFNAVLWAYERFDVSSSIDLIQQVGRTAAIFIFITPASSIFELSVITLGVHLGGGMLLCLACRIFVPAFHIRLSRFSLSTAVRHVRYGFGFFTVNSSRTLIGLLGITAVGNRMDPGDVTAYSVARQLVAYSNGFLVAVTQTAASRAVHFHASGQRERLNQLFSVGAIFATGCAFMIAGGFIVFGQPFMRLWQGGRLDHAYALLVILVVGELLPMSQWVTNAIVFGMERHGRLVRILLMEAAIAPLCALLIAPRYGLIGACIALAISATIFRGVLVLRLGIKLLNRSVIEYLVGIIAPFALLSGGLTAAFLYALPNAYLSTWTAFLGAVLAYAIGFVALSGLAFRFKLIRPQR